MEVNWIIIGIVVTAGIFLVVKLTRQNSKDKEKYEEFLNKQDVPNETDEELNNEK